ncbi:MAG: LysM peptidoglycan-binding domain-containing protein [Hyphomonadaceae bacterium]
MINYTVKSGDTLANIARQFYGDPKRYMEIALYNSLANPDRIFIGQTLQIPGLDELQEVAITAQRMPEFSITPPQIPNDPQAPLPGVYELPEISGSAKRDYLPALIALAVIGYVMMDKRRV